MPKAKLQKINVTAVFASFRTSRIKRRITPLQIMLEDGKVLQISSIRRSYTERQGQALHIHFVVKTTNNRFYDIVYDSKKMSWMMVVEIENYNHDRDLT